MKNHILKRALGALFALVLLPATALAQPVVTLSADTSSANEAGPVVGSFVVERTGSTASALDVRIAYSGSASVTTDINVSWIFIQNPNVYRVTIPSGAASLTVNVTPRADNVLEAGGETAQFDLVDTDDYDPGASTQAVISIADDAVVVDLTLDEGNAAEAGQSPGSFTVTRSDNGRQDQLLNVLVQITGTASIPADYQGITWSFFSSPNTYRVRINPNQLSATVNIVPALDNLIEDGGENVVVTLIPDNSSYLVGDDTEAMIEIADDVATVALNIDDADASEAGPDVASLTVTRSMNGRVNQQLGVLVAVGGSAAINSDYNAIGWSLVASPNIYRINISGNELSATVVITPRADNLIEDGGETIEITLIGDDSSYFVDGDTQGSILIEDGVTTVNLTANDTTVAEAGPDSGSFTVTRDAAGRLDQSLNVDVLLEGSATINADYQASPWGLRASPNIYRVVIAANEIANTVTIEPRPDNLIEDGGESVKVTLIGDGSTYLVGNDTVAEFLIEDDVATVNLVLNDGEASEIKNDPASLTVSRSPNGDLTVPLAVRVSVVGTALNNADYRSDGWALVRSPDTYQITILRDETERRVTLTPVTDSNGEEGDEFLDVQLISDDTGYFVGPNTDASIVIEDRADVMQKDGFEIEVP